MTKRKGTPIPTTTSLVEEALRAADDFMSYPMLIAKTGRSISQIGAAISWMRRHKAVDSVLVEGRPWWFATPETDTRSRTVDELIPEDKPRRMTGRRRVPRETNFEQKDS